MVFRSEPRDDMSAQQLERAFAIVLSHLHGIEVEPDSLRESMAILQEWAERTAAALLRRWHIRNYTIEAQDIVQQWLVLMFSKLFMQCKPGRPVAAFAYTILRRCCSALVRRESRNPLRHLGHDECHESKTLPDEVVKTETMSVLKHAITQLPAMQRWAVELWLSHRESSQPLQFGAPQAQRRFHNLMFHARRSLKDSLAAYFADATEKAAIDHVA